MEGGEADREARAGEAICMDEGCNEDGEDRREEVACMA